MALPGSDPTPPLGRFPAPMIEKHYRQAQRRWAERPVDEAGDGQAEEFEMAEEELRSHAERLSQGGDPLEDAGPVEAESSGEMTERLNATVLKTGRRPTAPRGFGSSSSRPVVFSSTVLGDPADGRRSPPTSVPGTSDSALCPAIRPPAGLTAD